MLIRTAYSALSATYSLKNNSAFVYLGLSLMFFTIMIVSLVENRVSLCSNKANSCIVRLF